MRYFTNVHDLGDLKSALAEAFEIKKDRYKYETLGKHKTCPADFLQQQSAYPFEYPEGSP